MTRVLVLTTGHDPEDGRLQRHLETLRSHGLGALLAARPDLPIGRRILAAPWEVLRGIRRQRPGVVLLPDPELFVPGSMVARALGVRAVLDLHEDYGAVARDRGWVPRPLRVLVGTLADANTRLGRRLAHATVVADRHLARRGDLVVRNLPPLELFGEEPPAAAERRSAVYVGDLSRSRGAETMVELAGSVPGVELELIGPADDDVRRRMELLANRLGCADRISMLGRLPYRESWRHARGALAGLSLLSPTPAYLRAVPTKLWEYFATGLPVIASDLPPQRALVEASGGGVVVGSVEEAAAHLRSWQEDPDVPRKLGEAGRRFYLDRVSTEEDPLRLVEAVVGRSAQPRSGAGCSSDEAP